MTKGVVDDSPFSREGLEPFPQVYPTPCFVVNDPDPERFIIQYYRTQTTSRVVAHVRIGRRCQGPPKHAHGGSVAAILDEAMGFCAWAAGHSVVAASITVDFRRPVPLEAWYRAETAIAGTDGRKVKVAGSISDVNGNILTEATGLFVELDMDRFRELSG